MAARTTLLLPLGGCLRRKATTWSPSVTFPSLSGASSLTSPAFAATLVSATHPSSATAAPWNRLARLESPFVVYTGPLFERIRLLKRVSVGTLVMAFGASPLFVSDGSVAAIAVLGGSRTWKQNLLPAALVLSSFSTALIQFCTTPYVGTIELHPPASGAETDGPIARIETSSFLGFTRSVEAPVAALRPAPAASRFANWIAPAAGGGNTGKPVRLYVDPEVDDRTEAFEWMIETVGGAAADALAIAKAGGVGGGGVDGGGLAVDEEATKNLDDLVKGLQKEKQ
ncbi:hypothetical protein DFJ73DRAFT_758961 [Zopfochytrium polystomum]|nr:hypothetical protein DFJ73DRAFT_758961 [Zopfochytrium polystomum]